MTKEEARLNGYFVEGFYNVDNIQEVWNAGYKAGMLRAAELADKFVEENHAWKLIKGSPLKMVSATDAIREEAEK